MIADAIQGPCPRPVDLSAALDASGVIGAWSWSPRAERCILDAGAADVLAGDPGLAGRPLPLAIAKACVHPEDRPAVIRQFKAVRERGGLFVAEYRTLSPGGQIRRILDRGRIPPGASSRRLGHGIIIDVTDEPPRAHSAVAPADALSQAVDRALECRDALEGTADSELQLILDMLLLHLGRRIAKASPAAARGDGH